MTPCARGVTIHPRASASGGRRVMCFADAGAPSGSGGASANFDRLVARNAWLFPQPAMDEERAALDAFWRSKGATDDRHRAALVDMGSDLAGEVAARDLYGNRDALGHAVGRLEALLPRGTDVTKMVWHCPEVLRLPLSEVAMRLIALKRAFPSADAERVLEGNPRALLADDLDVVARALDELQMEFPNVDMIAVVNFEPHIIHTSLPSRVRALKSIKPSNRSASLRAFYPPPSDAAGDARAEPMRNPALFAKVFLLETDCSYPRADV